MDGNLSSAPIVSEIIQTISRFLLTPEERVRAWWETDRHLKSAEYTAVNRFLNRMNKAPSVGAFLKGIRGSEIALFPRAVWTPFLGSFDIPAGRMILSEEDFKVVRDCGLFPKKASMDEINRYQGELRNRFGVDFEFDYWPTRTTRTDSAAAVIVEAEREDLYDPSRRLQAFRNQFYWARFADLEPARIRWFAVERQIVHSLSVRIEWREAWARLHRCADFGEPFLFKRFTNNWLDWKVTTLANIAYQLNPLRWKGRTVIFESPGMTVSADFIREEGTSYLSVKGKFSNLKRYPNWKRAKLGMRVGFSWQIPVDPARDILLPDVLTLLRWLADWSCEGDSETVRAFETDVVNRVISALR